MLDHRELVNQDEIKQGDVKDKEEEQDHISMKLNIEEVRSEKSTSRTSRRSNRVKTSFHTYHHHFRIPMKSSSKRRF